MLAHCATLAGRMPLIGFYLQTAVGGMRLSTDFWRRFAALDNVIGIKVAPFNRYATLDVVRGVAASGRAADVSLYTGNDDHIVLDLLLPFRTELGELRFVGGLLGHWSVWTKGAVAVFERCRAAAGAAVPADLLALDSAVTDCNAAFFDAANDFHGVIAGCHEVLRRQGLLEGRWCLDPAEDLGPGQAAAIDRVYRLYPELSDDAFVAENLGRWLS
jgi:dihydrodipicolinate synthase/N-acetylneuraminate lyase